MNGQHVPHAVNINQAQQCLTTNRLANRWENIMNRKKKLNDAFNKKLKKLNAKLRVSNKPKYISKAEREKIALTENQLQS